MSGLKEGSNIDLNEEQAFMANISFLDSSGISRALFEEKEANEGINDWMPWLLSNRPYPDSYEIHIHLIKENLLEDGKMFKHVYLDYDGECLVIRGAKEEGNFKIKRGTEIEEETMKKIKSALKKAFEKNYISLLSKEDELSSD